jgi:elongation factor P
MKISANSIRAGNILEHDGKLWVVMKTPEHTKPGKGGAFVQVAMRDIRNGTKINERFSSTEYVERVRIEEKEMQYLFSDEDNIHLMDNESFEQMTISLEMVGDQVIYLTDGMIIKVEFYQEEPVGIALPEHVVLEIVEAEPVVKGQTAASSYKPAIMNNGSRVMVPPFIEVGTRVVVRTSDGTYVERDKS